MRYESLSHAGKIKHGAVLTRTPASFSDFVSIPRIWAVELKSVQHGKKQESFRALCLDLSWRAGQRLALVAPSMAKARFPSSANTPRSDAKY